MNAARVQTVRTLLRGMPGWFEAHRRAILLAFFGAVLVLAVRTFTDYGVPWDEPFQRKYGGVVWDYIAKGDARLETYHTRHYGPVVETTLVAIERGLGLEDTRAIFYLRHGLVFALFFVGLVFFFRLGERVLKDWRQALLAVIFLIASPRIFTDAFYNSKDIPFLSLFVLSMYTLVRLLDEPSTLRALYHALACAWLIDVRIVGVLAVALTFLWLVAQGRTLRDAQARERLTLSAVVYALLLAVFTIVFWPTLWANPMLEFVAAFREMSRYPWLGSVLYLGQVYKATELPWHYTPVWIAISTPIVYLLGLALGVVAVLAAFRRRASRAWDARRHDVLLLAWVIVPVLSVVLMKSVLYDGWRHSFFLYPALILLAVRGYAWLWGLCRARVRGRARTLLLGAVAAGVAAGVVDVGAFMVRNHPHAHVFFNRLIGGIERAKFRFEMDYWGLSYREALEWVLKHDGAERLEVYAVNFPGRVNIGILPPSERARINAAKPGRARYVMDNFRTVTQATPAGREAYAVRVDGVSILSVYLVEPGPRARAGSDDLVAAVVVPRR